MKISGLKQRKIALPRPKVSLRLKRPTLSRGKLILLCVAAALLIACCVLGFVYSDTAGELLTQQAAERYQGEGEQRYAQASAFFPVGAEKGITDIYTFRSTMDCKLLDVSLEATEAPSALVRRVQRLRRAGRHRQQGQRHRPRPGSADSGSASTRSSCAPAATSPRTSSCMTGVILDEKLAWQLFGSYDLAGITVTIGGKPFVIAGVVALEERRRQLRRRSDASRWAASSSTSTRSSSSPAATAAPA